MLQSVTNMDMHDVCMQLMSSQLNLSHEL